MTEYLLLFGFLLSDFPRGCPYIDLYGVHRYELIKTIFAAIFFPLRKTNLQRSYLTHSLDAKGLIKRVHRTMKLLSWRPEKVQGAEPRRRCGRLGVTSLLSPG